MEKQQNEDRTHGRSASSNIPKKFQYQQIDEEVVRRIEDFGYPFEFTMTTLRENKLNYATTSYYLFTL